MYLTLVIIIRTAKIFPLFRDGGSDVIEKYKYKWSVPIKDVCVVDADIITPYEFRMGPGRTTIVSPKLGLLPSRRN